MRDYGKLLREYRTKNGIKQSELAKMIGVTQPFLSQLEVGKVEIFAENLREKVEDLLGIKGETAEDVLAKIVKSVEANEEGVINSPKHYQIPGCNFESIHLVDAIIEELSGILAFYVGNTIKYLIRAEKKNGREDYEKAKVYLQWAELEGENVVGIHLDEVSEKLNTDWPTIISGICDGMNLKKALVLNEIFKYVAIADYTQAKKYLDKLLEC